MTPPDYHLLSFWWDVIQTAILTFVAIYTWVVNRTKANRAAIQVLDNRLDELRGRVVVMEHSLQHVPGDQAIARIHTRIDQVGQSVRHMEGEMKQLNQTLHLIQQYLLEKD